MKTKFIESKPEAGNARSFYFELPNDIYSWVPGQYIALSFVDNDESHDNKHWFTIASAPATKKIQVTTRLTDSVFKNKLNSLKPGDEVIVTEAEGDFVWKESEKPIVFVAGGIGITPFHSILSANPDIKAHLIYVNRDENYVYKDQLEDIKLNNPDFKISYLFGAVNKQMLENADSNLYESLVYLSGPEPMVELVGSELISSGLGEDSIVRDWFPGYDDTTF